MIDTRAIVFADVAGSTGITEGLGDEEGRRFIASVVEALDRLTRTLGGTVIKTIGDEIMCTFPTALEGVVAAVEMQRTVQKLPGRDMIRPRIRIGLNFGPVVPEDGDVYGDAVNVAARVAHMAQADQVLTTAETMEALPVGTTVPSRSLGDHSFRGKGDDIGIREILWEDDPEALTALASDAVRHEPVDFTLTLRIGGRDRVFDGRAMSPRKLGRDESAHVMVNDSAVSRSHAELLVRGPRFYLSDHSTNGTFVRQKGHDAIFVHRDEILLQGSGEIRLGRNFGDADGPVLHYRVEVVD